MDRYLVVGIAQPVERQIVVLDVVGSNPTTHPTLLNITPAIDIAQPL
jgi:hypothetical protein